MAHTTESDTAKAVESYAKAQERRTMSSTYIRLADETLSARLDLHDSDPDMRCSIAMAGALRQCANALLEAADAWQALGDDYAAHAAGVHA